MFAPSHTHTKALEVYRIYSILQYLEIVTEWFINTIKTIYLSYFNQFVYL